MLKGNIFIDRIINISSNEKDCFLQAHDFSEISNRVAHKLGKSNFDELYYSHDIEGGMFQLLCTVYPDAKRICFGDALGNVYEKEVHLSFLKNKNKSRSNDNFMVIFNNFITSINRVLFYLKLKVKALFIADSYSIVLQEFKPDAAALILPVDQSGNFLKNIPLAIPGKNNVLDVVKQSVGNTSYLNKYINSILLKYQDKKKWLLLTDNFAEGNFIDFDTEIDMWVFTIKERVALGDVVFLKSHPGETLARNEAITDRIGDDYEIVELDKTYKRYPIEIWSDLVLNCRIICMSYPVLSLKYLYNIDVIQPMDDAFIERWFPEWTWASYKNSISLYMEPLIQLTDWDGKSVLYSGNI